MQNNDFDKSLRDLLNNNPEPDYNPADWDRMEDLLHHAGAVNPSASQGASGTSASNAAGVAKGILAGSKPWLLAAMVTLTGVNVAVLVTSQNPEDNAISLTQENNTETESASAEKSSPSITSPSSAIAEGKILSSETEGQEQISAGLHRQNADVVNGTVNEPVRNVSGAVAGNNPGVVMFRRSESPRNPASANLTFGANSLSGASGENSGGFPVFRNGLPAQTGQEQAMPCPGNSLPVLPYLIAGTDTVTTLAFTLNTCEPFCLGLPVTDSDAGNRIVFNASLAQVPGAKLETNPENDKQASFCWTPQAAQARSEPYAVKVSLQNPGCPGVSTYTLLLTVQPSTAVRISGDTALAAGQETRLRAQATNQEVTFKWLPAAGLSGNLASAEVLAAPVQNTAYTLLATAANGCRTQLIHSVKVVPQGGVEALFVPNIFTPNADGINDMFVVKGMEPGKMDLTVYNRSGKLVYSSSRYANTWNGDNLPDGIYTYVLRDTQTGKLLRGLVEIHR